jgi:hypothetical protein
MLSLALVDFAQSYILQASPEASPLAGSLLDDGGVTYAGYEGYDYDGDGRPTEVRRPPPNSNSPLPRRKSLPSPPPAA